MRRFWTPDKLAQLHALRAEGLSLQEIARRLGRTAKAVAGAIREHGLPRHKRARANASWQARLRAAVTAGLCNGCIGRDLDCNRHTIRHWRRRLQLPPSPEKDCPRCNDHRRRLLAQQCQAWLANSLAEIKGAVVRERIAAQGWPADLRPREAEILTLLHERGPLTRREMYAAFGWPWPSDSRKAFKERNNSYTGNLLRRGLVVVLGHRILGGRGRRECIYALPLWVEKGAL